MLEARALLSTFTVNSNNDDGAGSLRQAILDANSNPGVDTIQFDLNGADLQIQPLTLLPAITDPLTIDGTTQPGYAGSPLVVINGSQIPDTTFGPGLQIATINSAIRGLVVNGFNTGEGILIGGFGTSGVSNNHVEGCWVGLDATGTTEVANGNGVRISDGAIDNTIGGASGQGNVISGNGYYGIIMEGVGTTGNLIQGNSVGVSGDKTNAVSNGFAGVAIVDGAFENTIGGLTQGAANLISGNIDYGILLLGNDVTGNKVQGNLIGTTSAGDAGMGDFTNVAGISISGGAHDNVIGGTQAGARNVIAGVSGIGVSIDGADTTANSLLGNYFGVDAGGTKSIGIDNDAIFINGSPMNVIGGTAAGSGNLISGAGRHGVVIFGKTAKGNKVQGNRIGTNADGTADLSNSSDGIRIDGAPGNFIGGTTSGAANLISGNAGNGITITNNGADSNIVQGNLIGVQADGTSTLPNENCGIEISQSASNNKIGGRNAGEGNVVAFNANAGIRVTDDNSLGNSLFGNAIFFNDSAEIALGSDGPAAIDPMDADTGPNGLQNFPVLNSANSFNDSVTIKGSLSSTANASFTLDFYSSASDDDNDLGQGEVYLGSQTVNTNPSGVVSFTLTLPVEVDEDDVITATATDGKGNTSEFSRSVVTSNTPNFNPVLLLTGTLVNYKLKSVATVLDSQATLTEFSDPGAPDFNAAKLTVKNNPVGKGNETLALLNQKKGPGMITVSGKNVQFGGVTIGTFAGGKGKSPLVVTFNAKATLDAVQAVVRDVTYANESRTATTPTRTIDFEIKHKDGRTTGVQTKLVRLEQ